MSYLPDIQQYSNMKYTRCGKSGVKLPARSLGTTERKLYLY